MRQGFLRTVHSLWDKGWPLVALLALGFVSFWATLNSFFLSDDFSQLASIFRRGPFGLWSIAGGYFRSLSSLSLWLDYRLYGTDPVGYHVTNVLLHCLCAYALYLVVRRLLQDRNLLGHAPFAPHLTALVFLTLSTHTEAVAWVSDRIDLLACLFALLSFYAYLRYSTERSPLWLAASALLYLAGAISKESVVAFPLVIVVCECIRLIEKRKGGRGVLRAAVPVFVFAAAACVYLGLRLCVTQGLNGGWTRSAYEGMHFRSMLTNLLRYPFRSLLLIQGVSKPLANILSVAGYALCGLGLLTVIRAARKGSFDAQAVWTPLALGLAALSQLLPVLPLGVSLGGTGGERFLYWPSALFCAFVVTLLMLAIRRRLLTTTLCVVFAIGSMVSTVRTCENWRIAGDLSRSILASAVDQCPSGSLVVMNLPDSLHGAYVFRNGFSSALSRWGQCKSSPVRVISGNSMSGLWDSVEVSRLDDGYRISLSSPGSRFVWYSAAPPTSGSIVVSDVKDSSFVFKVSNLGPNDRILYYSAGALHPLEP